MMRRLTIVVMLAAAILAGCADSDGATDAGYDRDGWDAEALAMLEELKTTVAESDYGCADWAELDWAGYVVGYQEIGLPMPAAAGNCTTLDEDILYQAFADEEAKDEFIEAKRNRVCERGAEIEGFTGLPYVDGGTWIVEPDTPEVNVWLGRLHDAPALNMCADLDVPINSSLIPTDTTAAPTSTSPPPS